MTNLRRLPNCLKWKRLTFSMAMSLPHIGKLAKCFMNAKLKVGMVTAL